MALTTRNLAQTSSNASDWLYASDTDCIPWATSNPSAVASWLLACATAGNMSAVPYQIAVYNPGGESWFGVASWTVRAYSAYKLVKQTMATPDKITMDAWFHGLAHYHRNHVNHAAWGVAGVFPNRLVDDYNTRASSAASGSLTTKRYVQNGSFISDLALWYNNRYATGAFCAGMIGCGLGDNSLISDAARYFKEWLTYSVTAEGYQGEWSRYKDYGYTSDGITYGETNIAAYLELAKAMADRGDNSLIQFRTTDGLFGTASPTKPKTIWTPMDTHISMNLGSLVLIGPDGSTIVSTTGSAGYRMHARDYLPVAKAYGMNSDVLKWSLMVPTTGTKDEPFGANRGVFGIRTNTTIE